MASDPYEKFYVELDGEFLNRPVGGLAADYAGTISAHKLISISRTDTNSCSEQPSANAPKPNLSAKAQTYVFVCDEDTVFTVRTTGIVAWVFRPEGTLRLHAVPAEAGLKYADESFELRIEGEQAWLGEDSKLLNCRNDRRRAIWERAKLDGADFRAVGNEPGWYLEILQGTRILLVADYGASRIELPLQEPSVDSDARITRWEAGELILVVIGRPCRDSMSGESFESTVVVHWGDRTLRGCGRALHYEYCIPYQPEAIRLVEVIDPTLQIQRDSPGRIGCDQNQLLCLGNTHQADFLTILERLSALPFVTAIHEAFFE